MVSCCTERRRLAAGSAAGRVRLARCAALSVVALLRVPVLQADEGIADAPECHEPLCYTASRLEAERNRLILYDIDIVDTTRGISRILADRAEATGLDFGSSDWVLTGHVRVFMPEGQLQADRARVQFADKRIDTMTAEGAPAQFQHRLENGQTVHGHATTITFNMQQKDLQLDGDSWLSDGCNEITSRHIAYDIATEHVRADSGPDDSARVHGTIRRGAGNPCNALTQHP